MRSSLCIGLHGYSVRLVSVTQVRTRIDIISPRLRKDHVSRLIGFHSDLHPVPKQSYDTYGGKRKVRKRKRTVRQRAMPYLRTSASE